MTGTPAIELVRISKSFSGTPAVRELSLRIGQGQFLSLLGPSGCGKSTILRAIAGFITPDKGCIRVAGRDITDAPAHSRPVKMVFQDYALFPHMNVATNIGFGCEMQGMTRAEVSKRTAELLDLIQLPEIAGRFPDELSGGQRQRVALARALAPDPDALLLDEPLGALDLSLRRQMQQELKSIQRSTGKTFVFVTHDQEEAMSMSDQIAVMNAGRIEQIGPPEEIYLRPATIFAARFVGAANLSTARVLHIGGDTITLHLLGQDWTLPQSQITSPRHPAEGEDATIVIRSDAISAGPGDANRDLRVEGQLSDRMYLGNRTHLSLRLANDEVIQIETRGKSAPDAEITGHCAPSDAVVLAETPDIP